jgi:signal transduction histidine kinase
MGLAMSLVGLLYIISRSLVFKRIGEIHNAISLIDVNRGILSVNHSGDELKEISDFCYMLDKKLRSEHDELELRIKEATQDLSLTKDRLETANKELEILNKAKTDFFSDISHELRTPLTAIKGAADIISRKYPSESPQYVEIIRRNTDHLTKLVVDFLDYSKIETGHLELDLKEYSIRDIIDEALKSSESEASRKSVIFVNNADDIRFCFDSTRMFQVMTNLLSNAVRFSPENGKITLTAEKTGEGQVKVVVEDQGPGVPREHQDDIFRKFYQIMDEKGYSFHKGSSGIGLAICKGLIEAHGGRIWVESKSSQGARFVLQIPMRQPR